MMRTKKRIKNKIISRTRSF